MPKIILPLFFVNLLKVVAFFPLSKMKSEVKKNIENLVLIFTCKMEKCVNLFCDVSYVVAGFHTFFTLLDNGAV